MYQEENKPRTRSGKETFLIVALSILGVVAFAVLINYLDSLLNIPYAEMIVFFAVVVLCIVLLNVLMTKYVYFLSDEDLYFVRSVGGTQRLLRKVPLSAIEFFGNPSDVDKENLGREKFTLEKPEKAMAVIFQADGKRWIGYFSPGPGLKERLDNNLTEKSWLRPKPDEDEIWGKDEADERSEV